MRLPHHDTYRGGQRRRQGRWGRRRVHGIVDLQAPCHQATRPIEGAPHPAVKKHTGKKASRKAYHVSGYVGFVANRAIYITSPTWGSFAFAVVFTGEASGLASLGNVVGARRTILTTSAQNPCRIERLLKEVSKARPLRWPSHARVKSWFRVGKGFFPHVQRRKTPRTWSPPRPIILPSTASSSRFAPLFSMATRP